jgi:hypothetical protein
MRLSSLHGAHCTATWLLHLQVPPQGEADDQEQEHAGQHNGGATLLQAGAGIGVSLVSVVWYPTAGGTCWQQPGIFRFQDSSDLSLGPASGLGSSDA